MTTIDFWFDALSPYAWLAFDRLPQALEGQSVVVHYQPVGACMRQMLTQGLATPPAGVVAAIRRAPPRRRRVRRSGAPGHPG